MENENKIKDKNNINNNKLKTPQKKTSSKILLINNDKSENTTKASTYIVAYINNQKNGKGKLIVPDQFIYEGNFKDDLFDGYGEYKSKQYNYFGYYSCGKKSGKGKEINLIKNIEYEGDFKDDKRNGFGKEKNPDGTIYIGEFKDNQKHGQGTLILDGIKTWTYKGDFKNDKISGKGRFKWNEKKQYIGEWENNELSGYGILINNNTKHIGYFSHNNKHGYGACFFEDQYAILGKWENDYIEGLAITIQLINLYQSSNNIINTSNEYNNNSNSISNEDLNNNIQIVKTYKGEIIQKDLDIDEVNEFKSSNEYNDMMQLYKEKFYVDFIQNNDKSNSTENMENNSDSKNYNEND